MSRKNFKTSFRKVLEQAKNKTLGNKEEKSQNFNQYSNTDGEEFDDIENNSIDYMNGLASYEELEIHNKEEIISHQEEEKETSVISFGATIQGDIESSGNIQIRGIVNGNITANGKVEVMGTINGNIKSVSLHCVGGIITSDTISVERNIEVLENGTISANCNTENLIVDGNYFGDANLSGLCELRKNSNFNGDVTTPSISIEKGAKFVGVVKEN